MSNRELLRLDGVPVYQNKMYGSEEDAFTAPRGDVVLVQSEESGLVHNQAFDPEILIYDGSYQNEQGHSPAFQEHITQVLSLIEKHFRGKQILEIGCGKGAFLEQMLAAGHQARGIDPAYEGDSPHILRRHFEPELGIRADAIVMRHVLEHIPSAFEFLKSIAAANGGGGLIYIEVPCLEWILGNNAWFDIFYEHVNYFRRSDFIRLFKRVVESGTLFGGQYIYVVADLATLRDPSAQKPDAIEVAIPSRFFDSLNRCADIAANGRPNAVWGAAAKGVMFSYHMQARKLAPALAIDINPAKQGRFLAGSGTPVLSPDAGVARLGGNTDIFVMNSNYLSEIRTMGGPGLNYIAVDQL